MIVIERSTGGSPPEWATHAIYFGSELKWVVYSSVAPWTDSSHIGLWFKGEDGMQHRLLNPGVAVQEQLRLATASPVPARQVAKGASLGDSIKLRVGEEYFFAQLGGIVYLGPKEGELYLPGGEGARIEKDVPIAMIEMMKLFTPLPAQNSGCLVRYLVQAGDVIEQGQPIAILLPD